MKRTQSFHEKPPNVDQMIWEGLGLKQCEADDTPAQNGRKLKFSMFRGT